MSPTLRWPVSSPWALDRRGSPVAYLSTRQRALLLYLAGTIKRGDRTNAEIGRVLGVTSRGQVSRELRRLRQLNLIGYQKWIGCRGRHRIWIDRQAARLRTLRRARQQGRNDSLSTTFGGFISRKGLEATARGGGPPLAGLPAARDGRRRGADPPHQLYATCPAGHSTRLGRRSWTRSADGAALRAVWTGVCRRCGGRPVREIVELRVPELEPRPLSDAEMSSPGLLERRRQAAAELVADPSTPWTVRHQLRRDYLDRGSAAADSVAAPRGGRKR